MISAADTALEVAHLEAHVAAFDLGGQDRTILDAPLDEHLFTKLLAVCRRERTIGLLAQAASSGRFPVSDEQMELVEAGHVQLMGTAVLLEQLLVSTSASLSQAGVDHWVLKGPSFAHLDWPDPSWRTFNDIDLLVAGNSDAAVAALVGSGSRRRTAEVSPGFDSRFGKGTTLMAPSGFEIDIHRTLVAGALGLLIKLNELVDGSTTVMIGGRPVPALGRPQRLVHACYHAALGGSRPHHATCRDVAELVLSAPPHERAVALELGRSWQGEAALARGLVLAADLLELPDAHPLIRWGRQYRPTALEERRLHAYFGLDRSFARQALEGWRVLPGVRERFAYGRHLLFASREHLADRNQSAIARLIQTGRLLARRIDR